MVTKLEVNIRSLLSNCEELSKDEINFWRLKKYIKSLDTMIEEVKDADENNKSISNYYNRLQELKVITNYQETPQTISKLKILKTKQYENGEELVKELNQIQNSKNFAGLRKELIGEDDGIRKRNTNNNENESMDEAMRYYSNAQEKITEDMLSMTRSLKEQTETANKIIKRDTQIASKSAVMSDNNIHSLAKESDTLQDHSRKACKCWMWIMIALVMMIFIFMVLFMKIMKKKTY